MKFRHLLALQLGMTVSELCDRLTAAEEASWIAYYRIEPFGDQRADMRNALIAQIQYNSQVKKDKARKLQDFMLFAAKPERAESAKVRTNFENFIALQQAKGIK